MDIITWIIGLLIAMILIMIFLEARDHFYLEWKFNQYPIKRNKILSKLEEAGYIYCRLRGVRVLYYDNKKVHTDSYGYIQYVVPKYAAIHLAKEHSYNKFKAYTFLHEIGHYIAIWRYGDHSELAADKAASQFVRDILTPKEVKYLGIEIEYLLDEKKTKGYQYEYNIDEPIGTYDQEEYEEDIKTVKDAISIHDVA